MYKPGDLVKSNKSGSVYEIIDWKSSWDGDFKGRVVIKGPAEMTEVGKIIPFLSKSNMIPYNSKKLEEYM